MPCSKGANKSPAAPQKTKKSRRRFSQSPRQEQNRRRGTVRVSARSEVNRSKKRRNVLHYSMNNMLTVCPACQKEISKTVRTCPQCGHSMPADSEYKAKFGLYWAIPFTILGTVGLLLSVLVMLAANKTQPESAKADAAIGMFLPFIGFGLSLIGWIPYFRYRVRE